MAKRRNQAAEQVVEQVAGQAPEAPEAPEATEAPTAAPESNGHGSGLAPSQRADKRTFSSEADARAAGPQAGCDNKWRVWSVTGPGGTPVYLWASNYSMAVTRGAQHLGVTAVCMDKPPVAKEALAAGLAALTPEEREALLAQYRTS
jgi:hypothetical protein